MARIYMRVVVENRSSATLRLKHFSTSGEWTPGGWAPNMHLVTAPGAEHGWQAEGAAVLGVALQGVEARAWYEVVNAAGVAVGELYVFANSPWVESQYGNTFHVHAPKGYFASYLDAAGQKQGGRATLVIQFRDSAKVAVKDFLPSINGFQFSNGKGEWSDQLSVISVGALWNRLKDAMPGDLVNALGIGDLPDDLVPLTHADSGMCGGMAFAAMDYFNARQLPPIADSIPSAGPAGLPKFIPPNTENHPLFQFIRGRLLDSFDFTGRGHRWLSYTSPIYPDDDEGALQSSGLMKGKSWVSYREEWPRIRALLDQGQLATVGLVQADNFDIGKNHQVLAYAYEQSGQAVRLWIYDPNFPSQRLVQDAYPIDDTTLDFDITDTSHGITVTRRNPPLSEGKHIYAILYMDHYVPHLAPNGRVATANRPRSAVIATDSESFTTGGTVERTEQTPCGDTIHYGQWVCRTTTSFIARLSGFRNPEVVWRVNGQACTPGMPPVTVNQGGTDHAIRCIIQPGGLALELSSGAGETYAVPVTLDVNDAAGGEPKHGEESFDVSGQYSGMKLEDHRVVTQCIVKTIPVPPDLDVLTAKPPGPTDPDWNPTAWKEATTQRLESNPAISAASKAAIQRHIDLQVSDVEYRAISNKIAAHMMRIR